MTQLPAMQRPPPRWRPSSAPSDGLVNNAGWDTLARFVDGPPELWDRVIAVNLKGVLHATYASCPACSREAAAGS